MHPRAKVRVKPAQVVGFHHNRRTVRVHLVAGDGAVACLCGHIADTVIPLDGFPRLDWKHVCPTCLDAAPGFLDWWRANHQPLPY